MTPEEVRRLRMFAPMGEPRADPPSDAEAPDLGASVRERFEAPVGPAQAPAQAPGSWPAVLRDAVISGAGGLLRLGGHAMMPGAGTAEIGARLTGGPDRAPQPLDPVTHAERFLEQQGLYHTPDSVPTTPAQRYTASTVQGMVGGAPFGPAGIAAGAVGGFTGEGGAEIARELGLNRWGEMGGRLIGGLAGGFATPGVVNAGTRMLPGRPSTPTAQALERLEIPSRIGAVVNDSPMLARVTEGVHAMPGGGAVEHNMNTMLTDLGRAVERTASRMQPGNVGTVVSPQAAGQVLQHGVENWLLTSRGQENGLWNQFFYNMTPGQAGGTLASPMTNTRQALNGLTLATEREMPDLAAVMRDQVTTGFRQVMQNNPGSVSAAVLREFRTHVGEMMDDAILGNVQQGAARRLYGALSEDLRDLARQAGALDDFNAASAFTRQRHALVDRFGKFVIGRGENTVAPEQAYNHVASGLGQGDTTLQMALQSAGQLPTSTVMGTAMHQAGRAANSAPGAAGGQSDFSAGRLNTYLNSLSPEARAVYAQQAGGQTMDDLALAAARMHAARRFANSSQTAGTVNAGNLIGSLGTAGVAAASGNWPLAGAAVANTVAVPMATAGVGSMVASRPAAAFLGRQGATNMTGGRGATAGALGGAAGFLSPMQRAMLGL